MKYLKLHIGVSLFTATWGLLAIIPKPAIAETITTDLKANSVSTKAINLLVAQRPLDLEKFCQNYPYNSQCAKTKPISSPEKSPKPSEDSQDVSQKQPKSGWAIVPEISTLGLGGHVVRKITPQFNARVGLNAFGMGLDIEDSSAKYEGDINLFNVSTMLDFHPGNSGFRLSGGLAFTNNNVKGTATTEETIEIGDREFTADELGSVDVDLEVTRNVAPYLGIGWGNPVAKDKGLGFWFNAGVMFGGSPKVEITPNINDNVPQDVVDEIEQAAEQEAEEIEEETGFLDVYPVVSLGASYQF
jgi:hypothetical protein